MENLLSTREDSKQVSNAEAVDRWMGDAVTPDPNDSPPTNTAAAEGDTGSGSGTGSRTGGDSGSGNDNSNNSGSDSPRGADRTSPNTNGSSDSSNPRRVAEPEEGSNLFVAGLAPTVDDAVLFATYARFGTVISAKVMLRVATGVSRGFGFVLFEKAAQAEAAREATHGTAIKDHGGRLQVSVSKHRGENLAAESRVVYLRNVPTPVFEDAARFEGFLGAFGAMERCVLRAGCTAALTHLIVTFDSVAAARKCVAGSHGKTPFPECAVALMAKMEEPQSLREQRLRACGTARRAGSDSTPLSSTAATSSCARYRSGGFPSDSSSAQNTSAPTPPPLSVLVPEIRVGTTTVNPANSSFASRGPTSRLPAFGTAQHSTVSGSPVPPMLGGPSQGQTGFIPPMPPPMPPSHGAPLPPPFGMPFPGMWPGFPPPPMPPMQPPSSSSAPPMPPPSVAHYNWGGAMPQYPGMYPQRQ